MANGRLKWGVLGTGNIARQFCAGMGESKRGEVVAVGSRTSETARQIALTHGISKFYGSYVELIDDREVDAVYLSLPNSMHRDWTVAALVAGKHVLCEKPLAANASEAQEMFATARRAGKTLIEAFMYRSHPQTLAVREALQRGLIGELRLIRTSFCFRTLRIADNIRFKPELAGGVLMDVGCYCINFSRFFAGGEPAVVQASGRIHETGVDEMAAGTLVFPNGVMASFTCGMSVQADNTAWLCGTEGFIEIPIPWKPPAVEAVFKIGRGAPPRMDVFGGAPSPPPPPQSHHVRAGQSLYALEADDFAAAVLEGQPPRISASDSIGNMRVLDELRRQIFSR